jgi:hypothetical protein
MVIEHDLAAWQLPTIEFLPPTSEDNSIASRSFTRGCPTCPKDPLHDDAIGIISSDAPRRKLKAFLVSSAFTFGFPAIVWP